MEENWSMDKYFKEHKSIIEQISNYLKILKPAIFCIVALACILICIKYWNSSIVAVSTLIVLVLYLIVNIYLVVLSKLGKDIPKFFSKGSFVLIVMFAVSIMYILLTEKNSWGWIISVCSLFLVNLGLSQTYKDKWDMPDSLLEKITKLQWLGILIAFLQLVIAYPQLKQSFKSPTSRDIDRLYKLIESKTDEFNNLSIPDIPDSLVTEEIIKAREYQRVLIAYYKYLDQSLRTVIQYVIQTCDNDVSKNNVTDLTDDEKQVAFIFMKNQEFSRNVENVLYFAHTTKNCLAYINNARDFYLSGQDSTLCNFCLSLSENKLSKMKHNYDKYEQELRSISTNQKLLNARLNLAVETKNIDAAIDISKEIKKEVQERFATLILSKTYRTINEFYIDTCFDFVTMLNLLQYKYAYKIDY